jgi:hypothetical protein
MANSYNISRSDTNAHPAPFDFCFEWDDGTKETFIVVSLHGAKALGETFKSFGYEAKEGCVKFEKAFTSGDLWKKARKIEN